MTTIPEPTVQPVRYLVTCLPDGHDDRYLFTIQVEHRSDDRWAVINRARYLGADGTWSFGFEWSGGGEPVTDEEIDQFNKEEEAWKAEHRFDLDTALRLAKDAARSLTYCGYGVAEALAGHAQRTAQAAPMTDAEADAGLDRRIAALKDQP